MRQLELDGTKARYERLKLLPQAETFGVEISDEMTAPFHVRWDEPRRACGVFLESTLVAKVDAGAMKIFIREGYPERFDHAILRAVRNAADAADEIGKRQRSEGKEKSSETGLFTRTSVGFRPEIQDEETFHRAALGLESLNRKLHFNRYAQTGLPRIHDDGDVRARDAYPCFRGCGWHVLSRRSRRGLRPA